MNIADILRKYIEPTLFIQGKKRFKAATVSSYSTDLDSRISVLPNNARAVLVVECTQPVIKWACNTGKCIDGSPLLLKCVPFIHACVLRLLDLIEGMLRATPLLSLPILVSLCAFGRVVVFVGGRYVTDSLRFLDCFSSYSCLDCYRYPI